MELKCSYCGRANTAEAIHCYECGTELTQPAVLDKTSVTPVSKPPPPPPESSETERCAQGELKCSYCGRSNIAEAIHCYECGTKLTQPGVSDKTAVIPVSKPPPPPPVSSETEWRARNAWKCLGMFLVFEIVVELVRGALDIVLPGFRHWSHAATGHFFFSSLHYAINILTMLYFARIQNRTIFVRTLGLEGPPSHHVWFAVVLTLAIRLAGHLMFAAGWSKGVSSSDIWGFKHTFGPQRYLFLTPALMAPFCEELYMRGFLYRAFRGSYSIPVSTFLIVGIMSFTHMNQFYHSWVAAVDLSALTVLQCFLRERGNLWDCIASHLVYNTIWIAPYALSLG